MQNAPSSTRSNGLTNSTNEVPTGPGPRGSARWIPVVSSGVTTIGVACAAAYVSVRAEEKVGIAAWVAVAIVGTASLISTSRNSSGAAVVAEQNSPQRDK